MIVRSHSRRFSARLPQRLLLAMLLMCIGTTAGMAEERRAALMVGAFVQPQVRVEILSTPQTLNVSAADVRAGFIDIRAASALRVRSNNREGFAVDIRPMHPEFSDVDISYGDGIARMAGEPVRLVRRNADESRDTVMLSYRFRLRSTTSPGTYPWPLDIAATPL